jgi:hypothetical protein
MAYSADEELPDLIDFIAMSMPQHEPITEKDRWTIWRATRER